MTTTMTTRMTKDNGNDNDRDNGNNRDNDNDDDDKYDKDDVLVNVMHVNEFEFPEYGLHVENLNMHHIHPKMAEMRFHFSGNNKPHILGLCEIFLDDKTGDNVLHINNYSFIRKDCSGKKRWWFNCLYTS